MGIQTSKPNSSSEDTVATLNLVEDLVQSLHSEEASCRLDTQRMTNTAEAVTAPLPKKSAGYQLTSREQSPWPPQGKTAPGWQAPKPLPKRPTGRIYIGTILAGIFASVVWHVWSTFFSVAAYRVVKGDTLQITATSEGKVSKLHIREGQSIAKGDLLITLDSSQLTHKLERLHHELAVETAKLDAEKIRLRREEQANRAQYFQTWATLAKNREELLLMQQELEQLKSAGKSVVPQQTMHRLEHAELGQREFVAKTANALEALRQRGELEDATMDSDAPAQLRPIHARISALNAEILRTGAEIHAGEIRSPIAGTVVQCRAVVGQCVAANDQLLELVDNDSRRIELFVAQSDVESYPAGKKIRLTISPSQTLVSCVVVGSRQRFESAPDSIQYYYRNRNTLMPVILTPCEGEETSQLIFGAVTKYTLIESLSDH